MGGFSFPAQGARLVMIRHTALPRRCFPSKVTPSVTISSSANWIILSWDTGKDKHVDNLAADPGEEWTDFRIEVKTLRPFGDVFGGA
jgi:hypothetical protein